MRALGVDFGEKRVGLAVSDESGTIIVPVGTLSRKSDTQVVAEIALAARDREVVRIVVGHPVAHDGSEGTMALRVRSFARKLGEAVEVPVVLFGEIGTSVAAESDLREAGFSTERRARGRDAESAALILRDYLSSDRDADAATRNGVR